MSKVWVVMEEWIEGDTVMGVFSSEKTAKAYAEELLFLQTSEKLKKRQRPVFVSNNDYSVIEITLDVRKEDETPNTRRNRTHIKQENGGDKNGN